MSTDELPAMGHRGRLLDARLHLLDRQLLDDDGGPAGIVDDLELSGVELNQDVKEGSRVLGLVISPRTHSSFLGYERSSATAPPLLAALLRWRHRGTFLAAWADVARVAKSLVTLRPGYTRYSAVLEGDD